MKILLDLILISSTFLYYPFFLEEFEQPKAFALITFACFAMFWVNWKQIKKDRVAQALSLFVVSAAVSTYFSIDWHLSLFGNVKCRAGFLVLASYLVFYLAAAERVKGKISGNQTIDVILWCGFLASIYATAQVLGYDFRNWSGVLREFDYTRPMSTFGHPNFMANYLGMILPFGLWRANNADQRWKKVFYSILSLLLVVVIFLSLSRGMIIASALGVLVYFLYSKVRYKTILYWFLSVVAIVSCLFISSPVFRGEATSRLSVILTPGHARLEYPKAAIRIWRRYPWFGIGTDAYELGFQHQRTSYYWQIERAGSPHRAHNDFLNILATQGIFGALAVALLTVTIAVRALYSRSPFAAPAIASIVVFYVAGLTSFFVVSTTLIFILCAALLRESTD